MWLGYPLKVPQPRVENQDQKPMCDPQPIFLSNNLPSQALDASHISESGRKARKGHDLLNSHCKAETMLRKIPRALPYFPIPILEPRAYFLLSQMFTEPPGTENPDWHCR
jgi:hypothetical protein